MMYGTFALSMAHGHGAWNMHMESIKIFETIKILETIKIFEDS